MSSISTNDPGNGRGLAFWFKVIVTVLSALAASLGASAMLTGGVIPVEGAQVLAFGATAGAGALIMAA